MKLPVLFASALLLLTISASAQLTSTSAAPKLFAVRLPTGPAWDAAKSPNEQPGMREHSANIARMRREGVLVLGGRFGEVGLMVLRVPDEAAARAQFEADPTIAASWTAKDGLPRSQTAIGIFEVRDGFVQRAWHYPAVRPTPSVSSAK